MSSAFGLANALVTWKRQTAFLIALRAVATTITATRQPIRESLIVVEVTGSPTGSVVVNGKLKGVVVSQTLGWSGDPRVRSTTQRFDELTDLDLTGLTGGTQISAKATGMGGQPQHSLFTVRGPGHPISLQEKGETYWRGFPAGHEPQRGSRAIVQYEETWTPQRGDVVIHEATSDEYLVVGRPLKHGDLYPREWHCDLQPRDDSQGSNP